MENGTTTESLELQICNLQEKVLRMIDEEDVLGELKKETAADFRARIDAVRKERRKVQKELKDLMQQQYEEEGTVILDAAEEDDDIDTVQVSAE